MVDKNFDRLPSQKLIYVRTNQKLLMTFEPNKDIMNKSQSKV